jgi:ATP-binding cassette, subfamily G (WHITE), member 2, SNQ2
MAGSQGAVQEFNKEIEVSGPSSDADTIGGELATEKSLEQKREDARKNNPSGMSRPGTGSVDVEAAEAQFAELSRELSGLSRKESRQHSISLSRKSSRVINADPEKDGGETQAEAFDLEAHLRGQQYAEQEAGLKTKRIGTFI